MLWQIGQTNFLCDGGGIDRFGPEEVGLKFAETND